MEQLRSQLSHYFWSLNKWEAHMQTVVIPTPFTWFGCKYPQIKADSLQLKHILFKSIVVVYRAKNVRIVSMSQYLWTWLYIYIYIYILWLLICMLWFSCYTVCGHKYVSLPLHSFWLMALAPAFASCIIFWLFLYKCCTFKAWQVKNIQTFFKWDPYSVSCHCAPSSFLLNARTGLM